MGWLRLITALLEAAAAYFQHRTASVLYSEIAKAERKLDALENERDNLRDDGGNATAITADRLRPRIKRQQAYLSTLYAQADKRATDPDA